MTLVQGVRYRTQHALRIAQYVMVPEPQDAIAVCLNNGRPRRINSFLMLPAIRFDHEFRAMAGEIDYELTDRHLPPETFFREALAQQAPQPLFGVG